MVLLGNKKLAKKFNGKRVGQPQNANAFANANNANLLLSNANNALLNANNNGALNANAFMNANANTNARFAANANGNYNAQYVNENGPLYTEGFLQGEIHTSNPSGEVMNNISAFDAYQLGDNQSLQAIEAESELDIDVAVDDNNDRVVVITDELSGAQVMANIPAPRPQVVQPPQEDICEFPAQSVQLVRDVLISNTAPAIVDVQTDICGNVVSYTESMTRNMNATQWRAVNPAQLNGPVRQFSVNNQGTIINASGNVRLANSTGLNGFSAPQTTVSQQLVGGKKMHNSNVNAAYGSSVLSKWKGA